MTCEEASGKEKVTSDGGVPDLKPDYLTRIFFLMKGAIKLVFTWKQLQMWTNHFLQLNPDQSFNFNPNESFIS